jgi:hypothetical protein
MLTYNYYRTIEKNINQGGHDYVVQLTVLV